MKFIKFSKWIKLNEESAEEREYRELEAERRKKEFDKYFQLHDEIKKSAPKHLKKGSRAYIDYFVDRGLGETPADKFREDVNELIYKKLNFDPSYGLGDSPKNNADSDRVNELINDCYEDGTSVQQTVEMAISLLKSMGYTSN
jgi:hypothetical protein